MLLPNLRPSPSRLPGTPVVHSVIDHYPTLRGWVGDVIEVKEKSKQMALVLEARALGERDVPEYIEVDESKMTAKFVRIPAINEVPYPVMMEPHLIVEYYSR